MMGKIEGSRNDDKGWDGWMVSPTQWTWICHTLGDSEGQRSVLVFMKLQRVRQDCVTKQLTTKQYRVWVSVFALLPVSFCLQWGRPMFDFGVGKIPWIRERLPTLIFWPGEFHGLNSPWGCKQWDMTDQLSHSHSPVSCLIGCCCWMLILYPLTR